MATALKSSNTAKRPTASSGIDVKIQRAVVTASFARIQARGYLPQVKQQIGEMAINSSGMKDTA